MIDDANRLIDALGLTGHAVFIGPVLFGVVVCWGSVQFIKAYVRARKRSPFDSFSLRCIAFAVASIGTVAAGLAVNAQPAGLLTIYAVVSGMLAPTLADAIKRVWRKKFPKRKPPGGDDEPPDDTTSLFSMGGK